MTDAAALYNQGMDLMPPWNAPDDPEAKARAQSLIRQAAEAGHIPAMVTLSHGSTPEAFGWAITAARHGEIAGLDSALTSGDWPAEQPLAVLAAARAGAPWAQLAVGRVYSLGMRDRAGVLVATQEGAYGWLPGVADPDSEGQRWLEAAAASGWPTALLYTAGRLELTEPERALTMVKQSLIPRDAAWVGEPTVWRLTARNHAYARTFFLRLLDRTDAPMATRFAAYTEMAAGGDMEAQTWLAERYRKGDGVPKDLARARALYQPAADAGEVIACRELGKMLEKGVAGPADREGAQALYERAAELGADRYSRKRLAEVFGLTWYALDKPR